MRIKLTYPLDEIRLNSFVGTYGWLLHRISGLALVAYVGLHFWVLGSAMHGRAALDAQLALFKAPVFEVFEGIIIAVGAFHLFNGLRMIAIELLNLTRIQKYLFWVVIFCTVGSIAWAIWASFGRLLGHS